MGVKIFDQNGVEQTVAWMQAKFGPVSWDRSSYEQAYRLVELHEKEGPASIVVTLRKEDGSPQPGIEVIRRWPDAPGLPAWEPPPERWFSNGVHGPTNADGHVGFGMGSGDYYFPPDKGASSIWVGHTGYGSDCIHGLGMLGGTNHIHLEPVFQVMQGEPPEPPEPPEPGGDALERIAVAVEYMAAHWPFS